MREGTRTRVNLIVMLANQRRQELIQITPDQPTKAMEVLSILKSGLQLVAGKLGDPEPTPVTPTQAQLQLALLRNDQVGARAARLSEAINKAEAVLVADQAGTPIVDWNDEQRRTLDQWFTQQIQELQQDIEGL